MNDKRYVVLGLAHVRSAWFTEVARWSTSGSIPVEFVKCISIEELRARARSGRPFSAALLDAVLPAVDRDLIAQLRRENIPTIVVADAADTINWTTLGARAILLPPLERAGLLDALATHTRLIGPVDGPEATDVGPVLPPAWLARLVAITSCAAIAGRNVIPG